MIKEAGRRYGDLSFMLGGRLNRRNADGTPLDGPIETWRPNRNVVKAVISFAKNMDTLMLAAHEESRLQRS